MGFPFAIALVVSGFAGAELMVTLGLATRLRAWHFHDLIFYLFLPVMVFESALKVDASSLLRDQTTIYWGGIRGAVTLALALPRELVYWWSIQSIAFGLVPFNLLVQWRPRLLAGSRIEFGIASFSGRPTTQR